MFFCNKVLKYSLIYDVDIREFRIALVALPYFSSEIFNNGFA